MVIRTGNGTVLGQIAHMTAGLKAGDTPIAKEMSHFVHVITVISIVVGLIFFVIALSMGYRPLEAAVYLIGIIVAQVPEGLPATITVRACLMHAFRFRTFLYFRSL